MPASSSRFSLPRNVGALFVNAEQVSAHRKIGGVNRNVLRRQSLLDDPLHFIFSDRSQRRVVAVKKRQPDVFVANEE